MIPFFRRHRKQLAINKKLIRYLSFTIKVSTSIVILLTLYTCNKSEKQNLNNNLIHEIDWLYQVDSLIMPYWMMEDAKGNPVGNFPNYRYRDGKVIDPSQFNFNTVPEALAPFVIEQTDSLKRDFLRMKSRQTYAYGVAYHLTGNEIYLHLAKKGVDYLLEHGEYDTGSPVSYWQNGQGFPKPKQRNTQDLAYALTGLTMYYYLTRDEDVLKTILKVKNYVFENYLKNYDIKENTKLMKWVLEDDESGKAEDKMLLATLDQINAYSLFITPFLPDSLITVFKNDVKNLAYSLKDNFYSKEYNMFWGNLNNKTINESPTDFGHSIKSMWMCYLTGKLVEDDSLIDFGKKNALKLLETAYLNDTGSWAEMYADSTLTLSKGTVWWSHAELDQMAASLSLSDTSLYSKYLKQTYPYWEKHMIDHEYKETWLGLDEQGHPKFSDLPKAFHWKNGFHSLEHALIGYLSSTNYYNENATLYYAFEKGSQLESYKIKPYYFTADIEDISTSGFSTEDFINMQKTKVVFKNLR